MFLSAYPCFFPFGVQSEFLLMTLSEENATLIENVNEPGKDTSFLHHLDVFFLLDYRATFVNDTLNEGNEHCWKCKQTVNGTCLLHHLCVFFLSEYRTNFLKTLMVRKMIREAGMLTNCENSSNNRNTWPFFSFRCIGDELAR